MISARYRNQELEAWHFSPKEIDKFIDFLGEEPSIPAFFDRKGNITGAMPANWRELELTCNGFYLPNGGRAIRDGDYIVRESLGLGIYSPEQFKEIFES
jgi:hypothetical protein